MSGGELIAALAMLAILTALLMGVATTSGRGFGPGLWLGLVVGAGAVVLASWSGFSVPVPA
ncbi:hypothetical protein [Polymorphobacter sp.]|uniref:hypothetical protein n=1 Tax=Polymorphobacter sp. TaxID=1909290 RepID=UPI003F701EB9